MSIEDVAAQLRAVLAAIEQGRQMINHVAVCNDEAKTLVTQATSGTAKPEAAQAIGLLDHVQQELVRVCEISKLAEQAIRTYLDSIAGGGPADGGTVTTRPAAPSKRGTPAPTGVPNRHGDRYPERALPDSDDLPPRVTARRGGKMTGYVEVGGRNYGYMSASNDPLAQDARKRALDLGLADVARRLFIHVEMKAVAAMVSSGATDARVTINHSPCGSEPGATRGCHAWLPYFIPAGSELTVLGTDANGEPFERTYEGRSAR